MHSDVRTGEGCVHCLLFSDLLNSPNMDELQEKVGTSKLMEQGPCRILELFCPTSPLKKNELASPEIQARVSGEDLHSALQSKCFKY